MPRLAKKKVIADTFQQEKKERAPRRLDPNTPIRLLIGGGEYGETVMDSRGNFVAVPPNYMHGSLPF